MIKFFQFKIQLQGISKPPVWRKVEVPAAFTFNQLHQVIQEVFGWEYAHLYMFLPKGYGSTPVIAVPHPDDWKKPDLNAKSTKLYSVFTAEKQTFTYIYDFGDDWIHKISLEKIMEKVSKKPLCFSGKGACPPEDCGGVWGYEEMKEILSDPSHEQYEEMAEWYGFDEDEKFEPSSFDVKDANERLAEKFGK